MRILTFDIEDWYHIIQEYPSNILERWNNYEVRIHKAWIKSSEFWMIMILELLFSL